MKMRAWILALVCAAAATGFGAAKGSCISKAKSLGSSQTATLVAEYDSEEKETYDEGVMYYTVTLKRGQAYTIWITGGNAAEMDLEVDTNWEYYDKEKNEDKEPYASFDIESLDGGNTQVAYLYADDWVTDEEDSEDNDPKTGKYVVAIYGDIGAQTTLGFYKGIKNFTIVGSEESPKALTFSTAWKSFSGKLVDGEYHFRATLKGGMKYRVRTLRGTAAAQLELDLDDGNTEEEESQETSEDWYEDAAYTNDVNNEAYVVVPEATAKYEFIVGGNEDSQKFGFAYKAVPQRAISAHPAIPLLAENGYSTTFRPGRMSSSENYYDEIVDEHLCKIYLKKGERWVFETSGATSYQKMYAYGPTGKILSTNEGLEGVDGEENDTRVVITATAAGIYYVGVCDPTLGVNELPDDAVGAVCLTARNVNDYIVPDAFDPADDVAAGANWLVPYPTTTNNVWVLDVTTNDVAAAEALGAIHRGHLLNANDLYDVFAIACRKGYTYRLKASWNALATPSPLTLGASVFYLAGTTERAVTTTGSLSPDGVDDDLVFTPTVSGVHYVRVYVAEGRGLDFPAYDLHATVACGMSELGFVRADLEGGVGTWSVNTESYTYPSGAILALKAGSSPSIRPNAVTGFTAPAAQPVSVVAWTPGAEPATVSFGYVDAYDKKYQTGTKTTTNAKTGKTTTTKLYSPADGDATPAGAFAITPAATAATLKRTLWTADPADHFKFTAATNVFYNISVVGSTNLTLVLSNAVNGAVTEATPRADGTGLALDAALLPAGLTYVVVSHGPAADAGTAYSLTYSRAATGLVKFVMPTTTVKSGKTTKTVTLDCFSAKEGVQYATLTVARTGKEGKVRVRYATQQMTAESAAAEFGCTAAEPGVSYRPVTDGEIVWAANDKANKTISIPLIPDSTAHWSASNRVFAVRLYPVDEYELADGEYPARMASALDVAVVKITEANAAKPGTLALASCGESGVANAKAPAVSAQAGEVNTFTFVRTGGSDGSVALKVTMATAKGNTAKANVDYIPVTTNLVWANGDAEPKTVDVEMPATTGYAVSKTFTLTMAAVKKTHTPALAAKTATVTIWSDVVAQTAAAYAKTIPATTGLKLAATGSWFVGTDGVLRSAPAAGTLTYTLTGPGLFTCDARVVAPDAGTDAATLTCAIDREAPVACEAPVARVLGTGTHTVKFMLSDVTGGAYAAFGTADEPYGWTRFTQVTPADPLSKSAVVAAEQTALSWTVPEALAARDDLYVRVRLGAAATSANAVKAMATNVVGIVRLADGTIALPTPAEGQACAWTLDYARCDEAPTAETWTTQATGSTWTFSTVKAGAARTAIEPADDFTGGACVQTLPTGGAVVELTQAVRIDLRLMGTNGEEQVANAYRLVTGTLPAGVTVSATGVLAGTPTTAGETSALLQSGVKTVTKKTVTKNGKKTPQTTTTYAWSGTTLPVTFRVLPAGTAVGSFRAVIEADDTTFEKNARRFGVLALTVTSAGKFTGKVTLGGVAYTFTSAKTGYEEVLERDDALPGCTRTYRVQLTNTTLINKKTKSVSTMTLSVRDGALTNGVALAEALGEVELDMNVANVAKTSVVKGVPYRGSLYRSNGGTALGKAALADFVGYYTAALAPEAVTAADGVPVGHGYLTFTVAASGAVKVAGVLADGTSVSYSSVGQLLGDDLADPRACRLVIPFFAGKTTVYSAAGEIEIGYETPSDPDALPVLLPSAKVFWTKSASSAASRTGAGFCLSTAPTGGWYDKTVNLQAYYLGKTFALSTVETSDELPTYALAKGYSFTAASVPHDLGMSFVGNTLKADARKLVKTATTGLYDTWQTDPATGESVSASVNPWNVTVSFTRATGLIKGTLSAWEWIIKTDADGMRYATAQKQITGLAHQGVWLNTRDTSSESPLAADAVSAGFFLMQGTKSWKASLPFCIQVTSDEEPTWEEKDFTPAD